MKPVPGEPAKAAPDMAAMTPAAWRRRMRWLRWFLAEFLVVVSGVLVALALSSMAQDRRDRGREQAYLQQLSMDLASNMTGLRERMESTRERSDASARVLHRFWQDDPQVDEDLVRDLSLPRGTARYRPTLGTAEALISTGDLNLIRSTSLRAALLAHVEAVNFKLADIVRYEETYYRPAVDSLYRGPDIYQFATFRDPNELRRPRPFVVERVPFPSPLAAMLRDRTVYDGYNQLLVAHRNSSVLYEQLLEETGALKAQVDAEINPP